MNPFAHLVQAVTRPAPLERSNVPAGLNRTKYLLQLLGDGPRSTNELARVLGLETRAIWGLLKTPRERGQVEFLLGYWSLNRNYLPPEIQKAVELLRSHGWTVQRPN